MRQHARAPRRCLCASASAKKPMRPRCRPTPECWRCRASSAARKRISPAQNQRSSRPSAAVLIRVNHLDLDALGPHVVGSQVLTTLGRQLGRRAPKRNCVAQYFLRAVRSRWLRRRPGVGDQQNTAMTVTTGPRFNRTVLHPQSLGRQCPMRAQPQEVPTLPDGPGSGLALTPTLWPSSCARRAAASTDRAQLRVHVPHRGRPDQHPRLKLQLHQWNDSSASLASNQRGRNGEPAEMDDRSATTRSNAFADRLGVKAVRWSLEDHHPRIVAQRPRQLAVSDIGGHRGRHHGPAVLR